MGVDKSLLWGGGFLWFVVFVAKDEGRLLWWAEASSLAGVEQNVSVARVCLRGQNCFGHEARRH